MRSPLLPALLALAACAPDHVDRPPPVEADEDALEAVREAIRHTWSGYVEHAWGHDELRPLSRTGADWGTSSLGLTIVDGVDTLHLAGLHEERDAALAWIVDELEVDVDQPVSVFETSIRQLGGLLSAYASSGDPVVLDKARELADRLLPAFDSPTGMPYKRVNLATGAVEEPRPNAADVGSFLLEFATLSAWTGDPIYEVKARRALDALRARRPASTGLLPSGVDVVTGEVWLAVGQIGGGVDSAYEYEHKGARLLGDAALRAAWEEDVAAVHRWLAEETETGLWYGIADLESGTIVAPVFGALSAFFAGLLVDAGDLDRGVRLGESCWTMWTTYGPSPDAFSYRDGTLLSPSHELRPEVAESFWYLYRATGDEVWRERGRQMLADLDACCRVESGGYTVLKDVRTGERNDGMPSFWLAETLKYLYLLFADGASVPLDAWVLNTEAHPLPLDPASVPGRR